MIFYTENSKPLAERIAKEYQSLDYGYVTDVLQPKSFTMFSDKEFSVGFNTTVRNKEIFIVASTYTLEDIFEVQMMAAAAKNAGARRVIVIMPYYGYSRQDRKDKTRGCITSALLARQYQNAGVDHILTIDIHAEQILGFFTIANDNIVGSEIFLPKLISDIKVGKWSLDKICIVAPDAGGTKRASKLCVKLSKYFKHDIPMAYIDKFRQKPNDMDSITMRLTGDVEGKQCIIVDDLGDTMGTVTKAASYLIEGGAEDVSAIITHPVLSGPAKERIDENDDLKRLIVSDTIPHDFIIKPWNDKVEVVSCANYLAKAIKVIKNDGSISQLELKI